MAQMSARRWRKTLITLLRRSSPDPTTNRWRSQNPIGYSEMVLYSFLFMAIVEGAEQFELAVHTGKPSAVNMRGFKHGQPIDSVVGMLPDPRGTFRRIRRHRCVRRIIHGWVEQNGSTWLLLERPPMVVRIQLVEYERRRVAAIAALPPGPPISTHELVQMAESCLVSTPDDALVDSENCVVESKDFRVPDVYEPGR